MKRILKHYDKECTMTLEMDYKEYIELMSYLATPNLISPLEKMAEALRESIEKSDFIVKNYTTDY